jgi:hypothetical protein
MGYIAKTVHVGYVGCVEAGGGGALYLVSDREVRRVARLEFVPEELHVSQEGSFVAALSHAGHMFQICPTQENSRGDLQTKWGMKSSSFAWVTNTAFVVVHESVKLLFIELPRFTKELDPRLRANSVVQDLSGVRVIGETGLYLIQKIPEILSRAVSDVAVQQLFDAYAKFKHHSIDSYRILRQIRNLPDLANALARAAVAALDPHTQESLFRIAAFFEPATEYISSMNLTRFLNSLRAPELGFAVTLSSLTFVRPTQYIELLVQLRHFDFAMKAARLFDFSESTIAEEWARAMFSMYGDSALFKVLDKLETVPGVDFEKIANIGLSKNFRVDRLLPLAARIQSPKHRVVFLLNISGCDPLMTAIDLKDGEAIITALYQLKLTVAPNRFSVILSGSADAMFHYATFKKFVDAQVLCQIRGLPSEFLAELLLLHELRPEQFAREEGQLLAIEQLLPQTSHFRTLLDGQRKIVQSASHVSELANRKTTSSARQLVMAYVKHGDIPEARRVCEAYGISNRHFARLGSRTLARAGMWGEFEAMARASPALPLEEYAEIAFACENKRVGLSILERVPSVEKRIQCLDAAGLTHEADLLRQPKQGGRLRPS